MIVDIVGGAPKDSDNDDAPPKSEWERFLQQLKDLGEEGAIELAEQWWGKLEVLENESDFFNKIEEARSRGVAAMRHYKVKEGNEYKVMSFYIQDRFNSEDTTNRIQSEMFSFLVLYWLAKPDEVTGWESISELPLFAPTAQMVKDFYAIVELMRSTGRYKAVVIPHFLSSMPENNYRDFADKSLRNSVKDIVNKAFTDFVSLTGPVINLVANRRRKKGQPRIHIQLEDTLENAIAYLKSSEWREASSKYEQDLEFSGLIDLIVPTPHRGIDVIREYKSK